RHRRDRAVARRLPAVALGTRRQGRAHVRRCPCAGRRRRAAARRERIAGGARHGRRALGALRLDRHRRPATAPASGAQRRRVARAPRRRRPRRCRSARSRGVTAQRTPDVHPHRRRAPGRLYDLRRQRPARRGRRERRRRAPPARRDRDHVACSARVPPARSRPRPSPRLARAARRGQRSSAVRTAPVVAAEIVFEDDGTPRSRAYGDVYHPRSGALAQARHVFLADGALAERWRGRERFVVLETGFGLGNNFLATWAAWRDDAAHRRRLHYVSIDESPPTRAALAAIARDPALAPRAAALARRWPPLTCNLHRIAFDDDSVELLLA